MTAPAIMPTEPGAELRKRLPLLTNSEAKTFRSCRRKHKIKYRLLRRAIANADALRFGTLTHTGLEAWWRAYAVDPSTALLAAVEAMRAGDADPFDLVRAEGLLTGYTARWLDERYEVLAVEAKFDAPLVNPETNAESRTYRLAGKLDALVRDASGDVWIVEHKTATGDIGPGSEYFRRLRIDSQVSDYFAGARALGYEPAGCLYDVLGKPGIRPLLATPVEKREYTKAGKLFARQRENDETVEEFRARYFEHVAEDLDRYYQRAKIVRLEEEERAAAADLWAVAREMREAELADRFPRNPEACSAWGRTCEFFDVCTGAASLDDTSRFRQATDPHEELAE